VSVVVIAAFKEQIINDTSTLRAIDIVWRLVVGLGVVPACVALYFRLTIPETPRFTMDVERNVIQATEDIENVLAHRDFYVDESALASRVEAPRATRRDFFAHFGQWKNGKVLLGTCWSWFALDVRLPVHFSFEKRVTSPLQIAFYGLGLNSSRILATIGFSGSSAKAGTGQNRYDTLRKTAIGNIILAFGGLIPGYWTTFLFIDSWGRKPIQFMGFCFLTVIFIVMGFGYTALQSTSAGRKAFVFLYCLANYFQNFGPNTTTFIVPGEVFPTRYRSTAHGISAASGKLGAVVAQVGFARLTALGGKNMFLDHILEIFAFFMLTGIFSTLLIPETKGKSLEELSNEDQSGFVRCVSQKLTIQSTLC
jgi:PHS family inorganic phosphate transporter-like MFS transporter